MLSIDSFKNILKDKKLKVTDGRLDVLTVLENSGTPLDVAEIIVRLKKKNSTIDQATVYRILETLTTKGVLLKVQFHEDKFRYELNIGEHHHLVCDNCGHIEAIEDCPVNAIYDTVRTKQGFKITHHSLEFFGLCKKCHT